MPTPASTSAASAVSAVSTCSWADAPARSSASDPWATSFPTDITATWLQTCSISARRWLDRKTVVPSAASSRMRWRISRVP